MKNIKIYHYDAFTKEPNKGNPAAIVLNGDELTTKEMQEIAFRVGFNETAFSIKSKVADLKLRFFTPGQEMELCGHATISTIYALKFMGLIKKNKITIETKAGVLPINLKTIEKNRYLITMKQAKPKFKEFNGSLKDLAGSIGLEEDDIDGELPILYGSTGTWTLLLPIKKLSVFMNMKPSNDKFKDILKEIPKASIHPFCLETYNINAHMHGRHFSSPYSGTVEDPVTGTASGVMGAYYAKYIMDNFQGNLKLIVEQGQEIGKDGQVVVNVLRNNESYDIEIMGSAIFVKEFNVVI